MSIMPHVNDNDNKFVKYYTCSLLNTLQSKNVDLFEKNFNQILETFIWKTWLKRFDYCSEQVEFQYFFRIIEGLKILSFLRLCFNNI